MTNYDDQPVARAPPLETAPGPDEHDIENGLRSWARLAAYLGPLIGPAGFCALYARAQRVALPDAQCMDIRAQLRSSDLLLVQLRSSDLLLVQLRAHMDKLGPAPAMDANQAVLATFTTLLSGLIGARLTERLQASAWAEMPEGNSE